MASRLTKFLKLFIPDLYDKGTVVTDVFDPNFTKLDQNAEAVDATLKKLGNDKLDKDLVSSEYDTAKKIEDKIKGINERFKNFCPFPVGSVLQMWNETNPTSLYLGTTWELISDGKYVKTGSTALQTGGSNSITLSKENLPNMKVKVDPTTAALQEHFHYLINNDSSSEDPTPNNYLAKNYPAITLLSASKTPPTLLKSSKSGGGATGSFSSQTEALGSGNAIPIQPEYITLKYWKRTS